MASGCDQFLPFIIKRILGIKRLFPCIFWSKRMHLLTHVYGIVRAVYCLSFTVSFSLSIYIYIIHKCITPLTPMRSCQMKGCVAIFISVIDFASPVCNGCYMWSYTSAWLYGLYIQINEGHTVLAPHSPTLFLYHPTLFCWHKLSFAVWKSAVLKIGPVFKEGIAIQFYYT